MLDKEYKYFNENRNRFIKKYKDKYIVIIDNKIMGAFDTMLEAITITVKNHELGTFFVKKCISEKQDIQQIRGVR